MLSFQLKQVWGGMLACILLYIVLILRDMLACRFSFFFHVPYNSSLEFSLFIHHNKYFNLFHLSLCICLQVLSEYPEAKMTSEQQCASLGESYSELVNKLDEGISLLVPPFFKYHLIL